MWKLQCVFAVIKTAVSSRPFNSDKCDERVEIRIKLPDGRNWRIDVDCKEGVPIREIVHNVN